MFWLLPFSKSQLCMSMHLYNLQFPYTQLFINIFYISILKGKQLSLYIKYNIYIYNIYIYIYIFELRGIMLLRTTISQLVLAMAFFNGIFWNLTKITWRQMFCFTMMSLVISQLTCCRLVKIRQKGSSIKVLFIC